jgi:hypothetical protein
MDAQRERYQSFDSLNFSRESGGAQKDVFHFVAYRDQRNPGVRAGAGEESMLEPVIGLVFQLGESSWFNPYTKPQ